MPKPNAGGALLVASLTTVVSFTAHAADPATAECLSASEEFIKLRSDGKLRDARAELLICAAETCPRDVRNECARQITDVNASIPTIIFEAKDRSNNDMSAVKVTIDGQLLTERLTGTALPLYSGEHTFRFEAEGKPALDKKLVIVQGVKGRREVIVLGEPTTGATAGVAPAGAGAGASAPSAKPAGGSIEQDSPWMSGSTQRILGWSSVGVGAIGIALGVVFTVKRSNQLSDRDEICAAGQPCPPGSQTDVDHLTEEARTSGTVATVGFIAGGVFAAGGVALLLTAPSERTPGVALAPVVSPTFVGFMLRNHL